MEYLPEWLEGLSVRTANILKRSGFTDKESLRAIINKPDIFKIAECGPKRQAEIREWLGEDAPPWEQAQRKSNSVSAQDASATVIKFDEKQLEFILERFAKISYRSAAVIALAIYDSGKLGVFEKEPGSEEKAEAAEDLTSAMLEHYWTLDIFFDEKDEEDEEDK